MNRHEEMARAACDALGLNFEETSPSEIKARIYEMWDVLNAKLAEPMVFEAPPTSPEQDEAIRAGIEKMNLGELVRIPTYPVLHSVGWNDSAYYAPNAGETVNSAAEKAVRNDMRGTVFNDRIVKRREGDTAQNMADRYCRESAGMPEPEVVEEPILLELAPTERYYLTREEKEAGETLVRPKFRSVEWKPEDRERRLSELVELFDGTIRIEEGGKMVLKGMTALNIGRIDDLIQREFPGSGPPLFTEDQYVFSSSQRIPDGTADRV